jgi:hypothetical protein
VYCPRPNAGFGGELMGARTKSATVRFSLSRLVHSAVMLVLGTSIQFSPLQRGNSWMRGPSPRMTRWGGECRRMHVSTLRRTSEVSIQRPLLCLFGLPLPDSRGANPRMTENCLDRQRATCDRPARAPGHALFALSDGTRTCRAPHRGGPSPLTKRKHRFSNRCREDVRS